MNPREALAGAATSSSPPAPSTPTTTAPAAPAEPPRRRFAALRRLFGKLREPTMKKPEDYTDRRLTHVINQSFDGRGRRGLAAETKLGESYALAVDHLFRGRGGAQTPLGHVYGATTEYAYRLWDTAGQRPPGETPPEATSSSPAPSTPAAVVFQPMPNGSTPEPPIVFEPPPTGSTPSSPAPRPSSTKKSKKSRRRKA